eukprot:Nitzschia sp. Nitz4//scaffold162_size51285//26053//26390//NITZ4_006969-RA/size51285-snap-gene-0.12-mRNA-1//-1//CDS//3329537973//4808//frame0
MLLVFNLGQLCGHSLRQIQVNATMFYSQCSEEPIASERKNLWRCRQEHPLSRSTRSDSRFSLRAGSSFANEQIGANSRTLPPRSSV